MEIKETEKNVEVFADFSKFRQMLLDQIEGRRTWKSPMRLVIENTGHNKQVLSAFFPGYGVPEAKVDMFETSPVGNIEEYPFRMEPRDYQLKNFLKYKDMKKFAIFSDPGTGKTKVAIDLISYFYKQERLDAVLVLSYPKGVHTQWVNEQIPKHIWDGIDYDAEAWNGKKIDPVLLKKSDGRLKIFSGNIEMLQHARPFGTLQEFVAAHGARTMVIIDESDCIKSKTTKRWKNLFDMCQKHKIEMRAIMTGTPIAKNLVDEWTQLYFIDWTVLGHKYLTTFKSEYCTTFSMPVKRVFGGRVVETEVDVVTGTKNLDRFIAKTAPIVFRAGKSELSLPPKIYDKVMFDLSAEQKKILKDLRETFVAEHKGEVMTITQAQVFLLRAQQITCGFFTPESEKDAAKPKTIPLKENPRLESLKGFLEVLGERKRIVWARFRADIELINQTYSDSSLKYYGGMSDEERDEAINRFIHDSQITTLVANPASLGRGKDGLQKVCSWAVYYSNSFDSVVRWQSEDRINRIGMLDEPSTYVDIACSIDNYILRNLMSKKSLSDTVLNSVEEISKGIGYV